MFIMVGSSSFDIDKRLVFYEGKHVILKVLTKEDVDLSGWVGWLNDEANCKTNGHHLYPVSFQSQYDFLENISNKSNKLQLGIVNKNISSDLCGVISLDNINLVHRNADLSVLNSVADTSQYPYVFTESWSILLKHAFEQFGLYKVNVGTFHPRISVAIQRLFNFKVEGIRKQQIFKDNIYHDVHLLAVFRDEVTYPEIL